MCESSIRESGKFATRLLELGKHRRDWHGNVVKGENTWQGGRHSSGKYRRLVGSCEIDWALQEASMFALRWTYTC
jgi:hypothetical protein